jgi:hypothetical protein
MENVCFRRVKLNSFFDRIKFFRNYFEAIHTLKMVYEEKDIAAPCYFQLKNS